MDYLSAFSREFKPQLSKTTAAPNWKAADYSAGFARRDKNLRQGESAYLASLDQNAKVAVRNAEILQQSSLGQDLKDLAKFSKSLTDGVVKIAEKTAKDKEEALFYDDLFGEGGYDVASPQGEKDQGDEQVIQQANDEIAQAREVVSQETGNPADGYAVQDQLEQQVVTPAYRSGRANIVQARTEYAGYIQAFLQSNTRLQIGERTMTVQEALQTGDSAVISAVLATGRAQFARDYNLSGLPRHMVIQQLGDHIVRTDASYYQNITKNSADARRANTRNGLTAQTYGATQAANSAGELGDIYRTQANQGYTNGAYGTRQEANLGTLQSMLQALIARGDVDAIRDLRAEPKFIDKNGNPSASLGAQFPQLFDEAENEAGTRNRSNVRNESSRIEEDMYSTLAQTEGREAKAGVIERAALQLESIGDSKGARELRQNAMNLQVSGNANYVASTLQEGIRNGEIINAEPINQAYALGQISAEQAQTLAGRLTTATDGKLPDNEYVRGAFSAWERSVKNYLTFNTGNGLGATGNLIPGENPLISVNQLPVLIEAVQLQGRRAINELVRQNPELLNDPTRIQQESNRILQGIMQEVTKPGGRFYVPTIEEWQGNTTPGHQESNRRRLENIVGNGRYLARPVLPNQVSPQNLTSITNGEGGWNNTNIGYFNPLRGDKVIGREVVESLSQAMLGGTIPQQLQELADDLHMSPLALIQQQRGAYNLPPIPRPSVQRQRAVPNNPSLDRAQDITTPIGGAQALMSMGVPTRGSAYLSGNIMQESSWQGQRSWGEVMNDGSDRNGGLVSWMDGVAHNNFRLTRIEEHLGRSINQANDYEQLDAMLWEMKTYYPNSYRIFMNPQATERQLIRASREYWGYGHEGSRYQVAQETLAQL